MTLSMLLRVPNKKRFLLNIWRWPSCLEESVHPGSSISHPENLLSKPICYNHRTALKNFRSRQTSPNLIPSPVVLCRRELDKGIILDRRKSTVLFKGVAFASFASFACAQLLSVVALWDRRNTWYTQFPCPWKDWIHTSSHTLLRACQAEVSR